MEVAGLWHSRLINPNPKPKLQLRFAILLLLLLVLVGSSEAVASGRFDGATSGKKGVRSRIQIAARVLHEPFFPVPPSPAPSPGTGFESPPEPVNGHRIPVTNQPFFPLSPSFSPPAPPSETSIPTNVGAPHVGNKSNRSKKIVIATLVSLSAIVALCALLFVLHKQRDRDRWGSDKFVDETPLTSAGTPANPRVFQEPGPVTKVATNGGSDVLYLGTLDPFGNRTSIGDGDTHMDNAHTHSQNMDEIRNPNPNPNPNPNTKFSMPNGEEIEDRFLRRSPEIEPLPPLAKRPRPNNSTDSSDEESFYSPRCLSTSSSRSHSGSPLSSSVCKRLFSPPSQRPSTVKSPQSTRSYPSSATSSTPSSPSPLDSPPSPLDSPPSPPITPTVLPPPIRAHSHSPLHQFSRHVSKPAANSKPHPPTAPPHPNHQSKIPPPPPPPPPAPLFQNSPSAKHKPNQQLLHSIRPKEKTSLSSPTSSPAKGNANPPLPSSSPTEKRFSLQSAEQNPNKLSSSSPPSKENPDPPSPYSPLSSKSSRSPLPPLPSRPPPPFLSSLRQGKLSQPPPSSSKYPPPPPPPPNQNKPSPPDKPFPLQSRPPSRPQPALYSARTGQSLHSLAPTSDLSPPENSIEQANSSGTDGTPRPKLKPLHWDKVRASPDRAMVWDQLKSGSFQINEEMIETLFVYNTPTQVKSEATRHSVHPPLGQNQRILDPKKSQNIAILLRALNVTKEEVCDALMEGTCDSLGTDLLETLAKMSPSKEEEIRLKEYKGDISKLGPAERFLKGLLDIPFAFKRVDAMLYRASFKEEVIYIRKSFETLEAACEELRSSRLFLKLLEAVLKTGNRMNVGTIRGDAQAFKLDTLLKLVDVKGTDGKTTLLHFVVQEIIKAEGARVASTSEQPLTNSTSDNINDKFRPQGTEVKSQNDREEDYRKLGLQVVAGLSTELSNVKKAAGMDSDGLSNSVSNLARGFGKLRDILQMTEGGKSNESSTQGNFFKSMSSFLQEAEEDIARIQSEENRAFSLVRETTEYFHGDAAKEEGRPLRFFVVVKDFLGVLDQVCREIGKTRTRMAQSSPRPPQVVAHAISMPLFPKALQRRPDSSDDESSSP